MGASAITIRAVVLLSGASSLTVRLFCLLVRFRLLRAVDLLIVAWVFAYYVRLFYFSVRLRSICDCFAYIGASSLTMCVCFASCCVFTLCALVLLIGASSLTICGCSACWCVFDITSFVAFQHLPLSKSTEFTVAPQSAKKSENGCICFLATLAGGHPYHWRPG